MELSREKDEGNVGEVGVENVPVVQVSEGDIDVTDAGFPYTNTQPTKDFPQMSITVVLQGFSIGASLLPSLKVEYKVRVIFVIIFLVNTYYITVYSTLIIDRYSVIIWKER